MERCQVAFASFAENIYHVVPNFFQLRINAIKQGESVFPGQIHCPYNIYTDCKFTVPVDCNFVFYAGWKGALAVGLVLSSKAEPPDCHENLGSRSVAAVLSPPSEGCVQSASSNTENQLAGVGPAMPIAATAGSTPKFRAKAEKGSRLKYVPKQRTRS